MQSERGRYSNDEINRLEPVFWLPMDAFSRTVLYDASITNAIKLPKVALFSHEKELSELSIMQPPTLNSGPERMAKQKIR